MWLAHLSYPPDVLLPILLTEPQVLVQAEADIVAIQPVGRKAQVEQMLLERDRDG